MIRLLICGSRTINDYDWCYRHIEKMCKNQPIEVIISGCASGPDTYAIEYAQNNGIRVLEFPITKEDWKVNGKKAGVLRNQKMLNESNCSHVIGYNDCRKNPKGTNGTNHMMKIAKAAGKKVMEVKYYGK